MELREIFDSNLNLITEKSQLPSWALGMLEYNFARGSSKNLNNRIYGDKLLAREIKRKSEELKSQKIAGQLEHPTTGIYTRLDKVAHILADVSYDQTTKLASAKSYILDTVKGKDFLTLLKSGLKVGASMRGLGTIEKGYVNDDWAFDTVDFVLKPSFGADAAIDSSNLIESANSLLDEQPNIEEDIKKEAENIAEKEAALNDILFTSYERSLGQGFEGTFEFYKQVHAGGLREIMGLKKDSAVEKELTEEEKSEKIFSAYNESVTAGFPGDFNSWKVKFPNIVEFVSKPTEPTEKKVEPKAPVQYKTNWEEVKLSGFKGTMEDFRKQFPNITLLIPKPPLTEKEKFEEDAKKLYEGLKKKNPNSSITLETVKEMLKKEKGEDADSALRRKAISNVNLSISGSGAVPSKELLEKMIQEELEYLKKQKRLNWQAYENLLVGDKE